MIKQCACGNTFEAVQPRFVQPPLRGNRAITCYDCRGAPKRRANKGWRDKNYQRHLANVLKWQRKNSEKINIRRRESYKKNPEPQRIRSRIWREENIEKAQAKLNKWRKENPKKVSANSRKSYVRSRDPEYQIGLLLRRLGELETAINIQPEAS